MKFKIKFINYNYDTDFSECSIYLSKSNLELLKLEQGAFIDLNLFKYSNDNLKTNKLIRKRKAKLLILENVKDDFIYLTSILWFNLTNNQKIEFDYSIDQFYIEIESSSLLLPKLINECHFALVKCPDYNGSVDYDNLFKSYFQNKRFIELNDLIAINTSIYPQIYNESNFQSSIKKTYIFFQCTNLDKLTEGILDQNETRMYLIGNKNSFIPRDIYYLDFNSFNYFIKYNKLNSINYNLKMLNNYYNKLKNFCYPSIKQYSLANFILLTGDLGSGKEYLLNELACEFRMNLIEFDADDFLNETLTINEIKIKTNFQLTTIYSPCIVVFKNIDILIKSVEGNELRFIELIKLNLDLETKNLEFPILLIATSSIMNCDQILENSEFSKLFIHQLHIDNLKFNERLEILNFINSKLSNDDQTDNQLIDLEFLAKETTGFNLTNLINLFKKVLLSNEDKIINNDNLIKILKQYKKNLKIKNNLPDIPNVKWSDVGGLLDAKKEIFFTIQLTLKYGKLLNSKLKRCGLLFYGPPGTGKTLLAKAIATEFKLNFLSVKGPEIMNMFIGQSEENIRNIFTKAKSIAPSIIFFDELDSIARKRGKNNSSSGVMDRLVSTLLTELDNLNNLESNADSDSEFKPVFVIGATNRPDLLDSALLRYGRFDKLVYIGLDNSKEQRLSILKAITNKFEFDNDCNLEEIELNCPLNLTGADFYGLCSNAHLNALKRKINYLEKCEKNQIIIDDDDKIKVNLEDFKESIRNLRLSIDKEELNKYEQLNKKFSSK